MTNICDNCGAEFESSKKARTCSPRCRVTLARKRVTLPENVTHGVTLAEPDVTLREEFKFTIANDSKRTRTAQYYYQVPLSAIPVIQKGWPEQPKYLNGRQYFLWWKNDFRVGDGPVLWNPAKTKEPKGVL